MNVERRTSNMVGLRPGIDIKRAERNDNRIGRWTLDVGRSTFKRLSWLAVCGWIWVFLLSVFWGLPAGAGEVVYASCRGGGWDLWRIDSASGESVRLTRTPQLDEGEPVWLENGYQIVFTDNRGRIGLLDPGLRKTEFLALPPGKYAHPRPWPGRADHLAVTALTTVPRDDSDIKMLTFSGERVSSLSKLVARTGMETYPAFSPDGKFLAYAYWPQDRPRSPFFGVQEEIWLRNLSKGGDRQLTRLGADSYGAAWAPDGKSLAFCSNRNGNYDIWLLELAGGKPRALTRHAARDSAPTWSPDGRHLFFVSTRSGTPELWRLVPDSDEMVQISHDGCGIRTPHCR